MALHICDPATDRLLRLLARKKGKSLTETLHEVVAHQIEREREKRPLSRPLRTIRNEFCRLSKRAASSAGHLEADITTGRIALVSPEMPARNVLCADWPRAWR